MVLVVMVLTERYSRGGSCRPGRRGMNLLLEVMMQV